MEENNRIILEREAVRVKEVFRVGKNDRDSLKKVKLECV